MADLSINGAANPRIDASKWKKLTPQEIIKEQSKGEEIPPEILTWAQQMAAFAKIPDDVTYEQVDGDVGIDALNRLGIEDESVRPEDNQEAVKTEEPDAVKDVNETEENQEADEEEFSVPESETANEAEEKEEAEFALSDESLTADINEIRKRKERKGIQQ